MVLSFGLASAAAVAGVIATLVTVLALAVRLGRLLEQRTELESTVTTHTEQLARIEERVDALDDEQSSNAAAVLRLVARAELLSDDHAEQYRAVYRVLRDTDGVDASALPQPRTYSSLNVYGDDQGPTESD